MPREASKGILGGQSTASEKNRVIVLLAGTWLPCRLKRLLFWGFLHRITSEISSHHKWLSTIVIAKTQQCTIKVQALRTVSRLCSRRIFREATAHLSGVCLFSGSRWWPILSNGFPPKFWTQTVKFIEKILIAMPFFYPCHDISQHYIWLNLNKQNVVKEFSNLLSV